MMAKQQVNLYIDDAGIYVLLSRLRRAQKWTSLPLEPGLVKYGLIEDQAAVAAKLKELWQAAKIKDKKVIVAISGIGCLYHLLSLPELPGDLLPEAIRREASSLGVSTEEAYLSWQVLSAPRGEMRIYLAALPRKTVDALISTLRQAGLKPYLMDIKPLCLARAATESRVITIDTQPATLDITIVVEGIVGVVRSLTLPLEAPPEEKIRLMRVELERAIAFYNSAHMDKPIEPSVPIMVSGEAAQWEGLWGTLRGRENRPVQVLPSPMEMKDGFPSAQYMTNIGLALKEVLTQEKGAIAYSRINFNALPEVYRPKPIPLSAVLLWPAIIVVVALVAAGIWFTLQVSSQSEALSADLDRVNQWASEQQISAADIIALRGQVEAVEGQKNSLQSTLSSAEANRDKFNADIANNLADRAEVNNCLPLGVDLQSISITGNNLIVSGIARYQDDIFTYADRLMESGRFASVVITNLSLGEGEITFNLMLTK